MPLLLLLKGGAASSIQSIVLSSGISSSHAVLSPYGLQSSQVLLQTISGEVNSTQKIGLIISAEPSKGVQEALLEISERDIAQSLQSTIVSIDEVGSGLQDTDWNIYLDGRSIKGSIASATVTYDEGSVHNQFRCTSIDRNLFWRSNPYELSGESRIEVHIGSRILYFLLEDKYGNEVQFNLWGRSISARDDEPHSSNVDFALSSPMSSRSAAESIPDYNVVNWEIPDWILPDDFEYNGSKIEALQEIASTIGAIVRSQDDGSLTIRRLWPVRPVVLHSSTPVLDYDRFDNLIRLDYRVEKGEGFTEVEIYGNAPDFLMPDLYLVEENPCLGDTVTIRAYWQGNIPANVSTFVTNGQMTLLGNSFETISETVTFEDGSTSLRYPIYDLVGWTWVGSDGGQITFTQYEKEATSEEVYGVADIVYRSKYQTYRLTNTNVKLLLAAIIAEGNPGSSIKVQILGGGKAAPPMENRNLTSNPIVVESGTAFLDNTSYDKSVLRLRVPYIAEAVDGAIASVVNQDIGISGNYKIRKVDIIFRGPQIVEEIEVERCQI